MIAHLAVSVAEPIEPPTNPFHGRQKSAAVMVLKKMSYEALPLAVTGYGSPRNSMRNDVAMPQDYYVVAVSRLKLARREHPCNGRPDHLSRQRLPRCKQPLAVLRQQRLDALERMRAGHQIGHGVEIRFARIVTNMLLLSRGRSLARIRVGWFLGWPVGYGTLKPIIHASPSQGVSAACACQCHSGQSPFTRGNCPAASKTHRSPKTSGRSG